MYRVALLAAVVVVAGCKRNDAGTAANPEASIERSAGATAQTSAAPSAAPSIAGPHLILRPAGHDAVTLSVEVQLTNAQRERGLMFRRDLDELAGMIFVFPRPEHEVFWMRNTYLPLDMIFITEQRRVLGVVRNATPMTDDPRDVPGDSLYVLEVRAGFADRHQIVAGTPVEMINVPAATE